MKNNEIHEANQSDFLKNVSDVLLQAQKNAKTAVNLSMVYAYYEIGRMIVEEEQHGENRATYGKKLLKELSTYLTGMFGKGYSAENLKLMRRFYSIYSHDQIGETVFTPVGWANDTWYPRLKGLATVVASIVFLGFAAVVVVYFVQSICPCSAGVC